LAVPLWSVNVGGNSGGASIPQPEKGEEEGATVVTATCPTSAHLVLDTACCPGDIAYWALPRKTDTKSEEKMEWFERHSLPMVMQRSGEVHPQNEREPFPIKRTQKPRKKRN